MKRHMCWGRRVAASLLMAGGLAACGAPTDPPTETPPTATPPTTRAEPTVDETTAEPTTQQWAGKVSVFGVSELKIELELTLDADGQPVSGTLDIPEQGASDIPLADLVREGDQIRFALEIPGVEGDTAPRFELTLADDDTMSGTMFQRGLQFGVELAPGQLELARPQTPQPPFPYAAHEVTVENADAGITLAGTLTVPTGDGPHPAVLLITGSGAQDRDETVFGHKPFWVLADDLTRRGVAVLRLDDRGVGGSGGDMATSTSLDFVTDVEASLAMLRAHPEVDPARVGLLGHSEGGIIAPRVAAAHPDAVAFVVLLAGTGLPGSWILPEQNRLLMEAMGVPAEDAAAVADAMSAFIALTLQTPPPDDATLAAAAGELGRLQTDIAVAHLGVPEPTEAELDANIAEALETFRSPWMQTFLALDPRDALRQLTDVPVLAIGGTLDLQVPAGPNLEAIAAALGEAGNADVTIETLDGLNHLLQPATNGTVQEYAAIETTIDPAALDLVGTWIATKTGLSAPETSP